MALGALVYREHQALHDHVKFYDGYFIISEYSLRANHGSAERQSSSPSVAHSRDISSLGMSDGSSGCS